MKLKKEDGVIVCHNLFTSQNHVAQKHQKIARKREASRAKNRSNRVRKRCTEGLGRRAVASNASRSQIMKLRMDLDII